MKATYVPPVGTNPPMLAGRAVRLFDVVVHMHGLGPFEEERAHALMVPLGRFRVPVLGLDRIIKSKKATGRAKDTLALAVLSDALKAIRSRGNPRPVPRRRR